jgi:hypothetical protein
MTFWIMGWKNSWNLFENKHWRFFYPSFFFTFDKKKTIKCWDWYQIQGKTNVWSTFFWVMKFLPLLLNMVINCCCIYYLRHTSCQSLLGFQKLKILNHNWILKISHKLVHKLTKHYVERTYWISLLSCWCKNLQLFALF